MNIKEEILKNINEEGESTKQIHELNIDNYKSKIEKLEAELDEIKNRVDAEPEDVPYQNMMSKKKLDKLTKKAEKEAKDINKVAETQGSNKAQMLQKRIDSLKSKIEKEQNNLKKIADKNQKAKEKIEKKEVDEKKVKETQDYNKNQLAKNRAKNDMKMSESFQDKVRKMLPKGGY